MDEYREIVKVEEPSLTEDALEIIERRSALFDKLRAVAIKSTGPGDWIDQDGKPYLQGSGAEKAARRFGVQILDVEQMREDIEDDNGKYYLYTTTGKAALNATEYLEAVGTATSRDNLFSRGGKLELKDVDIGNIKKKSYTNFLVNAITRLLGIRNLTWGELASFGITKDGKTSVDYNKNSRAAASTKGAAKAEDDARKPFWTSDFKGKTYLFARTGNHFSEDFLVNLGFKASTKAGTFCTISNPDLLKALEDEFAAAEASPSEVANG